MAELEGWKRLASVLCTRLGPSDKKLFLNPPLTRQELKEIVSLRIELIVQTTSAPKLLKLKLFYVQYYTLKVKVNIRIHDSRLMTLHFLKD